MNCLRNPSCVASTAMNDGTGYCKMKTSNFTSAYQTASIPTTSYVKVCGQGRPLTPPPPPPVSSVNEFKGAANGIVVLITINIL
ncbi:hypothetical protein SUGI_1089410 [Cryptomeria japonica]|nr:hypothetical protein SUGI_1089410 [Cryptomeria japonica]